MKRGITGGETIFILGVVVLLVVGIFALQQEIEKRKSMEFNVNEEPRAPIVTDTNDAVAIQGEVVEDLATLSKELDEISTLI